MKNFNWFQYNVDIKKTPEENEGYILYQEFLDMIDWNYQKGLIKYHPVMEFALNQPEWPIKGDPYLISHDIYDMALSLIQYNTRWLFSYDSKIVGDKTKQIHEGQHRYLALKFLVEKGLIQEDTGILAVDYEAYEYDFLSSVTFDTLFGIRPLHKNSKAVYKGKEYSIASKAEGKLVGSMHHLLTWAHGVFKDRNSLVHCKYNNTPIIDFKWVIEPDKIVEILEKEKENILQNFDRNKEEAQPFDLDSILHWPKIEIYDEYKRFIERTALRNSHKKNSFVSFHEPWDFMIQKEICANEIERFNNTSDDLKLTMIEKIKKFNYPLPVILYDHVLVSKESVFFVLLMRHAVKNNLVSSNTILMAVQSMGADATDCWMPGHPTGQEFMQNYLTLKDKTKIKQKHNITITELPCSAYHLLLYKINRLFKNDDIIWLLPDDQKLLVVKNYKDKKDSVKK